MEALKGSCGTNPRSDGEEGTEIWFSFPYRPDPASENYDLNGLPVGDRVRRLSYRNMMDSSLHSSSANSSEDPNASSTKGKASHILMITNCH